MSEGESTKPVRLVVLPDFDDICWTHFRTPCGIVGVLQELPRPLRAMVSGFVGTLIACGIERVDLCMPGQNIVRGRRTPRRERPFVEDIPMSVRKSFGLLTWWLIYNHRREIAQVRFNCGMDSAHTVWRCLDCNIPVNTERAFCTNVSCPSWDKLHLCTGEPILHLMPHAA